MMLCKETNFQGSPIGKIPQDWEVAKLGSLAEIHDSKRVPLSKMERKDRKGPYPYCGANGIIDYINDYIFDGEYVLLAEDGGSYGRFENTTYIMNGKFWVNNHAHILRAIEGEASNQFLKIALDFLNLNLYIVGSTRKKLNQERMREIKIPAPPLTEQRAIVEVLCVVDSAVELADKVIAKTERLKKGLMQQLLTRGIGHIEYKDTPIGKTPKEWNYTELRDLISDVKNGFASGKRDEKGIVQVRMNNLTTDGRLLLKSYLKVPIPENLNGWLLKPNDFLFNNTNSIDLVGKSAIFKGAPFPCTFSNHFTRIRFKENLVLPEVILYHFITQWEKGYFKSVAIRHVGQAAVHTEYLLRLKIPLPPLNEQKKIVDIISITNRKLEIERIEKTKLEKIKLGLMDLLLTGNVRIKVD